MKNQYSLHCVAEVQVSNSVHTLQQHIHQYLPYLFNSWRLCIRRCIDGVPTCGALSLSWLLCKPHVNRAVCGLHAVESYIYEVCVCVCTRQFRARSMLIACTEWRPFRYQHSTFIGHCAVFSCNATFAMQQKERKKERRKTFICRSTHENIYLQWNSYCRNA